MKHASHQPALTGAAITDLESDRRPFSFTVSVVYDGGVHTETSGRKARKANGKTREQHLERGSNEDTLDGFQCNLGM